MMSKSNLKQNYTTTLLGKLIMEGGERWIENAKCYTAIVNLDNIKKAAENQRLSCTHEGTRTPTLTDQILSLARLPITPRAHLRFLQDSF